MAAVVGLHGNPWCRRPEFAHRFRARLSESLKANAEPSAVESLACSRIRSSSRVRILRDEGSKAMTGGWGKLLLSFCLGLIFVSGALGQAGTSTVRGEVSDPQGKQISGATVTLRSTDTGFTRTQTTNASGLFSFELIPPGNYSLEVEAKGFKKSIKPVDALVGFAVDADVHLELGSVNQVVEVQTTGVVA